MARNHWKWGYQDPGTRFLLYGTNGCQTGKRGELHILKVGKCIKNSPDVMSILEIEMGEIVLLDSS